MNTKTVEGQKVKHFQEILLTLNASSISLLDSSENWELWRAEYKTPVSTVTGHYLYLKHSCRLKEATASNLQAWKAAAGRNGYEIVVTPQSDLASNLEGTASTFRGVVARTSRQLLLDNLLKDITWKPIGEEEHFIDPDVVFPNGDKHSDATQFLMNWFNGQGFATQPGPAMAILTANGGVGKTTVSRILCGKIKKYIPHAIPILVESDQWRNLAQGAITLDSLWDIALSRRFEHAGRILANKTALKVLVREGLFVVVFDGFDELCVSPTSAYKAKDVLAELMQLLTPEDEVCRARILLTARETFWDTIEDDLDLTKVDVFRLQGFDNEQKKSYFARRLKTAAERDVALRISREISGGIYDGMSIGEQNTDRFSGVPFMLDLIARYVEDNPEIPINPYTADPFGNLLEDVCRRENRRQTLDLDPAQQLTLFEELFREHSDEFSLDDLRLYLSVFCNVSDPGVISRFTNHVFLVRVGPDKYRSRYEVLTVYLVARFLATGLALSQKDAHRKKIAQILAENSTGKTQLLDWLVSQLRKLDQPKMLMSIRHALEIVADKTNEELKRKSSMTIFHLINRLIDQNDKSERTRGLADFYSAKTSDEGLTFNAVVFEGSVRAFDFEHAAFRGCTFSDVEFRNCNFDSETHFLECRFEGTVSFANSKGTSEITVSDCIFSKEAEYSLAQVRNIAARNDLKVSFAEDVLLRALKKFRGDFGFSTIQYRHRKGGFRPGNPYSERVWDELIKQKIIEKHAISNVDEGGLNVVEDRDVKKEIISLLDNGIFGPKLKEVVKDLVA